MDYLDNVAEQTEESQAEQMPLDEIGVILGGWLLTVAYEVLRVSHEARDLARN